MQIFKTLNGYVPVETAPWCKKSASGYNEMSSEKFFEKFHVI